MTLPATRRMLPAIRAALPATRSRLPATLGLLPATDGKLPAISALLPAQVYYCTRNALPETIEDWRPPLITLSSKAVLRLPWLAPGTQVWIAARWFNNRGETGPISDVKCTHIAAITMVNAQAA